MQESSSSAAESTTSSVEEELVDALEASFGRVLTPIRSRDLSSDQESNGSWKVGVNGLGRSGTVVTQQGVGNDRY